MRHGPRPLWMHQLVEYIVGIGLVAQGLQSTAWQAPVIGGGLLVALTTLTRGPLAAFRVLSAAAHRRGDVVVIIALAVLAVQPWVPADAGGRLILGAVAALMALVWWQTDFRTREQRRAGRSGADRSGTDRSGAASGDRSTDVGRRAGRLLGSAVTTVRRSTKR